MSAQRVQRVLLKLSGEALSSLDRQVAIDPERLAQLSESIVAAVKQGVQVAVVVGGGNFLRGGTLNNPLLDRTTKDHMGMLSTVLNGLALRDALQQLSCPARVFSAFAIPGMVEGFQRHRAREALDQGDIVIFVGGTGNPFVTTDAAASLRALEVEATLLLKATKVDGVYDQDPVRYPQAKRYDSLCFQEALTRQLAVMDLAAFVQCQQHQLPIRVFNVFKSGALTAALLGAKEGTLIH